MNQKNLRIAVLYVSLNTFTQKDIDTLSLRYRVVTINCASIFKIIGGIWKIFKVDCVFCWFGSLRFLPIVFVAKILGKKIIIVSGGYDVANIPEIKYGNMYGKIHRYFGQMLFKMADMVTCVSHSNTRETIENAKVSQGKIKVIYHGFHDIPQKDKLSSVKKEKIVITVGKIDMCTIYRKGLLTIAKLSRLLPNIPFIFAGRHEEDALSLLKKECGQNVRFTGYLSEDNLADLFMRAKVYLQPSIHEAFGCSVAEAMLYNCIPIVSDQYALPEVVGKAGICIKRDDLEGMAIAVKQILNDDFHSLENPRERILHEFPINKRVQLLTEMIDNVCSSHKS